MKELTGRQKSDAKYRAKNKEILNEKARKYRNDNIEERRAKERAYLKTTRGRYTYLKKSAKQRGIKCDLTGAQYAEKLGDCLCYLCGRDFSNSYGHGMDRLNSSKGYTYKNVKPCCWECNAIKADRLTPVQAKKIIKLYVDNNLYEKQVPKHSRRKK